MHTHFNKTQNPNTRAAANRDIVQRKSPLEEEEPLQGKFKTIQKIGGLEEEELLQGKFGQSSQRKPNRANLPGITNISIKKFNNINEESMKENYKYIYNNKADPIQKKPNNIDRSYDMESNPEGKPIVIPAERTGLLPGSIQGIRDTYILNLETVGGHLYKREWGGADDFSNVVNWTHTEEDTYTEAENNSLDMIRAYGQALNSRRRKNARRIKGIAEQMNDKSRFDVKARFRDHPINGLGEDINGHELDSTNAVKWDFLTYIKYALETFADQTSMECETRLNPDPSGIDIEPHEVDERQKRVESGIINGPNVNDGLSVQEIRNQYKGLVEERDLYIGKHQASIDAMKKGGAMPQGFRLREAVPPAREEPKSSKVRPYGKKGKKKTNKSRR